MGQIIRLSAAPTVFPDTSTALDPPEHVLLIAIRWWVNASRHDEDPMPRLCRDLETAGSYEAAFSIDALMATLARSVLRPIEVHFPHCPNLSSDEKILLHAAGLAQAGDTPLAEKTLRTALLSAQGAEFALGPLEGIGELFAEARLFFRRRIFPSANLIPDDAVEPWLPASHEGTIH